MTRRCPFIPRRVAFLVVALMLSICDRAFADEFLEQELSVYGDGDASSLAFDGPDTGPWRYDSSMEPSLEEVYSRLEAFHRQRFRNDPTRGAKEMYGNSKPFKCNQGASIDQIAPVSYVPDKAQHVRPISHPTCGMKLQDIRWPLLSVHESAWVDCYGRAISCKHIAYESGGGTAPSSWKQFPAEVNDSIGYRDDKSETLYISEAFGLGHAYADSTYRVLTELLPKYLSAFRLLSKRKNVYIIIPNSNLVYRTLLQLGEDPDRIVRVPSFKWVKVGRAYYLPPVVDSSQGAFPESFHRECYERTMHDMFLYVFAPDFSVKGPTFDRIVVLMYALDVPELMPEDGYCTVGRCLKNGRDLIEKLEANFGHRFQVVIMRPNEASLYRTVNEIQRARVVIGVNGIGFGVVFTMQRRAALVDLNNLTERVFYRSIASRRGVTVISVIHDNAAWDDNGLFVEVDAVISALKTDLTS